MSKYYTTKESAEILKVNPETIRRKIRNKKLLAIKKESRFLIPSREINKLIKKYKQHPKTYKNKTNFLKGD